MAQQKAESRFASLRTLRAERQNEPSNAIEETEEIFEEAESPNQPPAESQILKNSKSLPVKAKPQPSARKETLPETPPQRRRPGRPPGRRSDPDYTQISAYIPLDLLLSVQDELAAERREKRQRTARPVSDLVEELLGEWLKTRKDKNPST